MTKTCAVLPLALPLILICMAAPVRAGEAPAARGRAAQAPAARGRTGEEEAPVPLFRGAAKSDAPRGDADPLVLRRRLAAVDLRLLAAPPGEPEKAVRRVLLNLFDDVAYTALLTAHPSTLLPYVAWRGPIEGIDGSQVVLVERDGQVAATIDPLDPRRAPGRTYRVLSGGGSGLAAIEEVDSARAPAPDAEAIPVSLDEEPIPEKAAPGPRDDGSQLDILGLYTPEAMAEAGGETAIRNLVALGVEHLDTTFQRSGVAMQARLVQVAEVAYDEDPNPEVDVQRLRAPQDGYLDEVHELRDRLHADIVVLVRGARNCNTNQCGRGFLMPGSNNPAFASSAFSLIAWNRITDGTYALAHEIGHNLGCNHALDDPTGDGAFNYSYGYKDPEARFSTLMAYWCGDVYCPKILNFSSPDVEVDGLPTGNDSENNALSVQNIRTVVANFRVSTPAPSGGNCNARRGAFVACQATGCAVCALKVADYPRYFLHHPSCNLNAACTGRRFQSCSRSCPAPTAADR